MAQYVGIVAQQHVGVVEQVVEVHRPGHEAAMAVGAIDFVGQRPACTSVGIHDVFIGGIAFRAYECVFSH